MFTVRARLFRVVLVFLLSSLAFLRSRAVGSTAAPSLDMLSGGRSSALLAPVTTVDALQAEQERRGFRWITEVVLQRSPVGVHRGQWRDPLFEEIVRASAIQRELMERELAPFPAREFHTVETLEDPPLGTPGIVTVQIPPQAGMRWAVAYRTHWLHWLAMERTAMQWWRLCDVRSDEEWLSRGISAFEVMLAMDGAGAPFANVFQGSAPLLEWTFKQNTFLSVARHAAGGNEVAALRFARFAVGLYQAAQSVGASRVHAVLRQLWEGECRKEGGASLEQALRSALARDDEVSRFVLPWLGNGRIWDPALDGYDVEKTNVLKVHLTQKGDIKLPALVAVRWDESHAAETLASDDVTFPCPREVVDCGSVSIEIDPRRFGYDANRFNNRNSVASVALFPGNARTFDDKARTIFWGPYFLRPSGEPSQFGVVSALANYVDSGLLVAAGMAPETNEWSFYANAQSLLPFHGMQLVGTAARTVIGERRIFLDLSTSGERSSIAYEYGTRLGYLVARDAAVAEGHVPFGLRALLRLPPNEAALFDGGLLAEFLAGESFSQRTFSYQKYGLAGDAALKGPWGGEIRGRGFAGLLRSKGRLPSDVPFDAQETGALRLDFRNKMALRYERLLAGNFELLAPIPGVSATSDTLFLAARHLRMGLFFDAGRGWRASAHAGEALAASGVTIKLPMGGDVSGAGSIVYGGFSLDVVVAKFLDGTWKRAPSVLLTLSQIQY